jgi:hypothetical protein
MVDATELSTRVATLADAAAIAAIYNEALPIVSPRSRPNCARLDKSPSGSPGRSL